MTLGNLTLSNLVDLKTKIGNTNETVSATIFGIDYPTTQGLSHYVWDEDSEEVGDDFYIVEPTVRIGLPGRWLRITNAQDIPGPTGPSGIQGIEGPIGSTGDNGVTGPTGSQGIQGIQGSVGSTGSKGDTGSTGAQGVQGIQGIQGEVGPQGIQGNTGSQGVIGATGPQGVKGDTGASGTNGTNGTNGSNGATGSQGPIGVTGSAPTATFNNSPSRAVNSTSYQLSTTKNTRVSYTVSITQAVSLLNLTSSGQVFLEISSNNSTWVTINSAGISRTLSVGITIGVNDIAYYNVQGEVPTGYYMRLRSVTSGGATTAFVSGQEVTY